MAVTGIPMKCGSYWAYSYDLVSNPRWNRLSLLRAELPAAIATTTPPSVAELTAFTSTSWVLLFPETEVEHVHSVSDSRFNRLAMS